MVAPKLYVTKPASDDDWSLYADTCTAKQDAFALAWAETGNQAAAYRIAYNVHERTLPNTVWVNAGRLAALPHVRKRADEYRQKFALEAIVTVRDMLAWELDVATADPNELCYIAQRACRHCYGHNHRYQWVDDDEYMKACITALDDGLDPPSSEGGYGYTRALDPIGDCPSCLGEGIPEEVIKDTRKLTGKARKLYRGLDYKNGRLVVLMHDQAKAKENVCRMLGAFKDNLQLLNPKALQKLPDGLNEQETARAYLTMIEGSK